MGQQKRIRELTRVLNKAVASTQQHFAEDYALDNSHWGTIVYLESLLAHLFLFDYIANALNISQDFRQNFLEEQFNDLEKEYLSYIKGEDPLKTIENRFNNYAEIPMHNEQNWFQLFIKELARHLQGSADQSIVQIDYDVTPQEDDAYKAFYESEQRHFQKLEIAIKAVVKKGKKADTAWRKAAEAMNEEWAIEQSKEANAFQRLKEWLMG